MSLSALKLEVNRGKKIDGFFCNSWNFSIRSCRHAFTQSRHFSRLPTTLLTIELLEETVSST